MSQNNYVILCGWDPSKHKNNAGSERSCPQYVVQIGLCFTLVCQREKTKLPTNRDSSTGCQGLGGSSHRTTSLWLVFGIALFVVVLVGASLAVEEAAFLDRAAGLDASSRAEVLGDGAGAVDGRG